ncbi:MAG: SEC-C domain-containing protein [Chitinophagaceae bacterium]|nr:SEC-C domain-containing protein [Chitinophagaceae bacterium]
MGKIGRNDACHCGSGKKYKHCCLNKENVAIHPFSSYASDELLKTLALLLVQLRNHGKNIRLERTILETLRHFTNSTQKLNIVDLRKDLFKYCQPHPYEDPPEEFFTELLYWDTGNHLVFPGIASNGVEIVQQLLNTVRLRANFPQLFLEEIEPAINFLLSIHNEIALSLGYTYRMFEDEHHEQLFIPEDSIINKYKDLFSIKVDDIAGLLKHFNLSQEMFNNFVFDNDKKKLEFEDSDDNPLFQRPFILSGDEYILVNPTAELFCLNDHILAMAEKHGCLETLLESYRDIGMIELYPVFSGMHWKRADFTFPIDESIPKSCLRTELLFKIDVDRLAYVVVMTEVATKDRDIRESIKKYSYEVKTRVEKICGLIKEKFQGHQILFLHVMHKSRILSKVGLQLNLLLNVDFSLFFSYEELFLLPKKWDFDSLTLWKYGKYLHEYENNHKFAPYNTHFSKMKWYLDHEESFYHPDKEAPSVVFFEFEIESEVRRSAISILDKKAIPFLNNGKIIFIPCYRKEEYYPVYISQDINQGLIASCLEEYDCPIWCVSSRRSDFHGDVYINGILYWLHEMFPVIRKWVNQLGKNPVLMRVTFDKHLYEKDEVLTNPADLDVEFRYKINANDRLIDLYIPASIRAHLYSSGNRGEYLLMNLVLEAIGGLQQELHVEQPLTDSFKEDIFRKVMPNGMKKFVNVLSDYRDLTLSNIDIPKPRIIPKADVSCILQKQINELSQLTHIPKKISEPTNQTDLLNQLVFYHYQKVKLLVNEYDGFQLLIFLMRRQEALLHNSTFRQVNYPVKQACYGHYYDVFKEFAESARDTNIANLALRILIEWVACWMPTGIKLPSDDGTDFLLAHVSEVMNYGSLSDEIKYGLREVELRLLPSGRLGIDQNKNKGSYDIIFDKIFGAEYESYEAKFQEYYERNIRPTPNESYGKYLDRVENIFKTEWGIGIHNIFILTHALVRKLFDRGQSVTMLSKTELYDLLSESKFTVGEIEAWTSILRFLKRDDVLKTPVGFQKEEVYPWRYNRRISYLIKPLIFIKQNNEEYILLSARHLYKAAENLVSIFHSGSLPLDKENKAIRTLLAERNAIKGKEFRDEIQNWLTENTSLYVYSQEITIKEKGFFIADSDKGDIDILAIDHGIKVIYSIECKNTNQSKVAYEFHLEIIDYLGKLGKNGLIQKHINRDQWLRENSEQVFRKLNVSGDYRLVSLVVSKYVLPTAFLRNVEIPIISIHDLKKNGLSVSVG